MNKFIMGDMVGPGVGGGVGEVPSMEGGGMDQSDIDEGLRELTDYISGLYDKFSESALRDRVLLEVGESRKTYHQELEKIDTPWPGASNMITPLTAIAVDELEPRMVAAVVGREPIIKAVHHPGSSTEAEAVDVTDYDNFVLLERVRVKNFVSKSMHEALLDGTVYGLLSWCIEDRLERITEFDPETGIPVMKEFSGEGAESREPELVQNDVVRRVFDGPKLSIVPVDYVYLPDDVDDEDWEKVPVIRYVGDYTIADIKRRVQNGEKGWMLPEDLESEVSDERKVTVQQESEQITQHFGEMPVTQKPVEAIEAYVNWDIDGDGLETPLVVLMTLQGRKVIRIRKQIDIFARNVKPLRRIRLFAKAGISWGRSVYSVMKAIQLGMDATWNRMNNSADIALVPWGFYSGLKLGAKQSRVRVGPGFFNEVSDPKAINIPSVPFNASAWEMQIGTYKMFFEQSFNVLDFSQRGEGMMGGPGKAGSTATGTLAVLQEGKVKHEYRGLGIQDQYLEIFKLVHDLSASNMPVEEQVAIIGKPIQKYTMSKEFTFSLVGSDSVSNRFIARKEVEDELVTLQPFIQGGLIPPTWAAEKILRAYDEDPDEVIDPELSQMVSQFLQRREEIKKITGLGLPPELATDLVDRGYNAEQVSQVATQVGKSVGEAEGARQLSGVEGGSIQRNVAAQEMALPQIPQ